MRVVSGEVLVAYLALVTVLMLTPGPDMLFVLAGGVRSGSRAGFVAAVGVAVARRSTRSGMRVARCEPLRS
jgi:threonine/homoserine/homoserine lactone efflux protein